MLDEHLPRAVDLLSDLLLRPAFHAEDVRREAQVITEEIKMVEDTPDDLVHELFQRSFWPGHPLGRSILGSPASVGAMTSDSLRAFFGRSYVAGNLVVAVAGNVEHEQTRDLLGRAFDGLPASTAETVWNARPPCSPALRCSARRLSRATSASERRPTRRRTRTATRAMC